MTIRPRTFHLKGWFILIGLFPFTYLCPMLLVPVTTAVLFFPLAAQPGEGQYLFLALSLCLGPLVLLIVPIVLTLLVTQVGNLILSRIKVSPHGLEARSWPYLGLRCSWEEIEMLGIQRQFGIIPYDVLYLKSAERVGPQITYALRNKLGLKTPLMITLTGFQGWPAGGLADTVRQHRPDLFATGILSEEDV